MADALLTEVTGAQAGPAGEGPAAGQPRADLADSVHAPSHAPADPGRGQRGRSAGWPGWVRAAMTQAPPRPAASRAPDAAVTCPESPVAEGLLGGRMHRVSWLFAAIWLVYLAQPASELWDSHDPVRRYLGLAGLAAFAAVFIAAFATVRSLRHRRQPIQHRWATIALAAEAALVAVGYLTIGRDATSLLIYVGVMAVFLLPTRAGWSVVAAAIVVSVAVPALVPGWPVDPSFAFQVFVSALACWGVSVVIRRNAQLAVARGEITRLALADERNRFARDLHDILGHSLTVVAVKAELAGRLASLDPQRAEAEIADVERIARQALADVRAAAAGYHEVTLARELASAGTALSAAGITAELPGADLPQLPRAREELFGWAVREGVTNVVRHSGAGRCRIRLTASGIEIADDGCGPGEAAPGPGPAGAGPAPEAGAAGQQAGPAGCTTGGHGLTGLCERAAAAGAAVRTGRSAWGGFSLRVQVP